MGLDLIQVFSIIVQLFTMIAVEIWDTIYTLWLVYWGILSVAVVTAVVLFLVKKTKNNTEEK